MASHSGTQLNTYSRCCKFLVLVHLDRQSQLTLIKNSTAAVRLASTADKAIQNNFVVCESFVIVIPKNVYELKKNFFDRINKNYA